MADFCKQCSLTTFGQDFKELARITKPEDWKNDLAVWVLCEGCGQTQVDPEGACVRKDCMVDHNNKVAHQCFPAVSYADFHLALPKEYLEKLNKLGEQSFTDVNTLIVCAIEDYIKASEQSDDIDF